MYWQTVDADAVATWNDNSRRSHRPKRPLSSCRPPSVGRRDNGCNRNLRQERANRTM